ncbi:MAG: GLPGLI family protein [Prevotellaceae bacterium]|jgi:GLPGLI family protein|nr:GLPGLI family protein [Prevotellaceae bacterium]
MKKYYSLYLILFLICISDLHAQWLIFDQIYRNYSKRTEIGKSEYVITYNYCFVRDTIKKIKYYDKQVLQYGEKHSRYTSLFAEKTDSLMYNYFAKSQIKTRPKNGADGFSFSAITQLQDNEKAMYEDIFFNYPKEGYLYVSTNILETEYIYVESIPQFDWKLQADTTTILGYKCIKAVTTFRGRDYEVWFTPFIPIRQGPWKFNGLPGLILKAVDTKGYFEWTAVEIEKKNNEIYKYVDYANISSTNRKDVIRLLQMRWKDPIRLYFIKNPNLQTFTINGKDYKNSSNFDIQLPHCPIPELE